jgi:hypothetical protein
MWWLAAISESPVMPEPAMAPGMLWIYELIGSLVSAPYFLFWIWMLVHCYRTEPDRYFWMWILVIAQPIGPLAYFFLRFLPSREFPTPSFLRRWTRGREIARLETAAHQIGNPHQFVQWGNALREVGRLDDADQAYKQAFKKEPGNIQALWGSAQVAVSQKRYSDVRILTRQVLELDPQYKFGDVSLAYGRALKELGENTEARTHLEQHVKRWRHPEAMYLLAELNADQGESKAARDHLQALIHDINGCPAAIARKHGRWKSRARQLLRKLGSS